MALSDLATIINNNIGWIATLGIIGFCIWKFIIQPRMNEGKPIRPTKEQLAEKERNRFKMKDVIDASGINDYINPLED